jgi:enoyl-CoA hydratase
MSDSSVLIEARGGAIWVTRNRPAALNAITPDVVAGVTKALALADDPEIKAVVW